MSKKEMLSEAAKLERKINGGKLTAKAKKKAQQRMYSLRYLANKSDKPKAKPKSKANGKPTWTNARILGKARKLKQPEFSSKQGILPGFLSETLNARIEELVAEKIFQALQRGVQAQAAQVEVVDDKYAPVFSGKKQA